MRTDTARTATLTNSTEPTALLFAPSREDHSDLSRALRELKMRVAVAADTQDAVALASGGGVSLILIDLDTHKEWKSTLPLLRAEAPRARLLAYSRLSEEHLWLDALEAGAFDFVCKPFEDRELRWILESALRARQGQLQASGGAFAGDGGPFRASGHPELYEP